MENFQAAIQAANISFLLISDGRSEDFMKEKLTNRIENF
jgi:uncharacterized protein